MGRSISAGASGGQVTVSGSVSTVNPNSFSPDPPVFLNKRHYNQNLFSRDKDWFITNVAASTWPTSNVSNHAQSWYVKNDPNKMWAVSDTTLNLQFSLYSDFREVYADFLVSQGTPQSHSGARWFFQPFHTKEHNLNATNTVGSEDVLPYTLPYWQNSSTPNIENLITFPNSDCKVYFRGRWISKADGSSGKFCEPLSICYNPMPFTIDCGILGPITFENNFSRFQIDYNNEIPNKNYGFERIGLTSDWMMDNVYTKIFKPATEHLVSIGPDPTYRTYFKLTSSPNQNFFLSANDPSVTDWPAGDYDIYIIGNGGHVASGSSDRYENGGRAGEIKKLSMSFTEPFTASATNSNTSDNYSYSGQTILTINGSEAGRSQNGGGALGGTGTYATNYAGADAAYIQTTAGEPSDYAERSDYSKHSTDFSSNGKRLYSKYGMGFGAGWGGIMNNTNYVAGFGGSGFGNIYIPTDINWSVVFVHKP